MNLGNFIKSDDFKNEKHVPFIEVPENIVKNEFFEIEVLVGKEIPHPNTLEHYIKYIDIYVKYDDSQTIKHIGKYNFEPEINSPAIKTKIRLEKSGTIIATEYCNLHGLWETNKHIELK